MSDKIWTTIDNKVILISEMQTSHIVNSMKMILRSVSDDQTRLKGSTRTKFLDLQEEYKMRLKKQAFDEELKKIIK